MNYGIIVAAGKSERIGLNVDKAFLTLGTKPVLAYSLQAFQDCALIDGVILVVRKDRLESARGLVQIYGYSKVKRIVVGGTLRQNSVMNGLAELPDDARVVAIHDGARPCVMPQLIEETIKSAKRFGSGVAAVKITDTVKEVEHGLLVAKTIDRTKLWAVQTPQTFKREILAAAMQRVLKSKATVTDEASALELAGYEVHLVSASWANLKVTIPDDLKYAAALLKL
jgi:2-C-methyl-D-erythritol 4-phosphate cytidylyltransferase